jgi:hypothetical protein
MYSAGVGQTNSYCFDLNHFEVSPVTRRFSALFTRLKMPSFLKKTAVKINF